MTTGRPDGEPEGRALAFEFVRQQTNSGFRAYLARAGFPRQGGTVVTVHPNMTGAAILQLIKSCAQDDDRDHIGLAFADSDMPYGFYCVPLAVSGVDAEPAQA